MVSTMVSQLMLIALTRIMATNQYKTQGWVDTDSIYWKKKKIIIIILPLRIEPATQPIVLMQSNTP